ncbi:Putative Putative glycosyltransferase (fragment) [Paraburkholderia piptadeniae]|uniref:Putative glycosyltransferase n=1 Tax=Paraburkholderia piptadeniae TaxID=1701573 RepID=A0A1N7SRV3_9BURK
MSASVASSFRAIRDIRTRCGLGLLSAPGDVLVSLDADLQVDLDAIPRMLAAHRSGAEIVYGVRSRRDTDTFFKRVTAQSHYRLLRRLGVEALPDHADFRLMSRRVLEALRDFREVILFLRGIIPLLGFRTAIVEYERHAQLCWREQVPADQDARACVRRYRVVFIEAAAVEYLRWSDPVDGISRHIGLWALFARLFTDLTVPGWASTVMPICFLCGLQMLFLGVIGGYVAKIYSETKQRPRFIVEKALSILLRDATKRFGTSVVPCSEFRRGQFLK